MSKDSGVRIETEDQLRGNRRLREHTRWAPQYDLDGGLRETAEWWRQRLHLA